MRLLLWTLFVSWVGFSSRQAAGQEADVTAEPISTDRPDQTESSATVPRGAFQLEMGWSRIENDDDGVDRSAARTTQTLLRIGVVTDFELRLGFDGFLDETVDTAAARGTDSGAGDASVGLKWRFLEEAQWRPEVALLAGVSLPTGEISSRRYDPTVRLSLSHTLTERLSLAYNLGVAWESEEDAGGSRHTLSATEYTVALGADITSRIGAFVEFFGDAGLSRPGGPANSVDAGLVFGLQPNLQLDAAAGVGLSEDADDWFVTVGVSFRFPR
ncbi:MAG: transporter [Planctomycetota bacterium]